MRPRLEELEPRYLLSGTNPYDVNCDGFVNPLDALYVVDRFDGDGANLDVNRDGVVTDDDAYEMFRYLNREFVEYTLVVRDSVFDELGRAEVEAGERYTVDVFVRDTRLFADPNVFGVFAAFADVTYDNDSIDFNFSTVNEGADVDINYEAFPNFSHGDIEEHNQRIEHAGGGAISFAPLGLATYRLFSFSIDVTGDVGDTTTVRLTDPTDNIDGVFDHLVRGEAGKVNAIFDSVELVVVEGATPDPIVEYTVEVRDLSGAIRSTVSVGEPFTIIGRVTDLRDDPTGDTPPNTRGVFAAFTDVEYDPDLLSLANLIIGPSWQVAPDGVIAQSIGLIDEVGGIDPSLLKTSQVGELLFVVNGAATSAGVATIDLNAPEGIGNDPRYHDTLVHSIVRYLEPDEVSFGSYVLDILA